MKSLLKIYQQTFWQTVVKVITSIGGFIILGIVSRNYGEAGTGVFTLALTYLTFFYIFSDFGFNAHLLGKLQEKNYPIIWRKLLGARILWSILLMALALFLAGFLPMASFSPQFRVAVILGVITIFFYALNSTANSIFQAKLKYEFGAIPVLFSAPAGVISIILMAKAGFPVQMIILGYVLSWIIYGVSTILLASKFTKYVTPIFDIKFTKLLFTGSWPLAATLVLNTIYFRLDAFILSFYHPSSVVGVYNTAYQVFQAVLVLPTFIMNSFYPMMLQTIKLNIARFGYQIRLAVLGLLFCSVGILVLTYILSPLVIKLITGAGFAGSVESLQILSFGFPAYFLSALALWIMVAKKMYKEMVIIYLVGLIFNALMNIMFIPKYSYIGASWITGISEYLILMLQIGILYLRK
ncbi:MAG: flippase [Patescibacteria group bacterium]